MDAKDLNWEISKLLSNFTNKTGVIVNHVNIDRVKVDSLRLSTPEFFYLVEVELKT